MVQTKVVEEIKTHILCLETFFFSNLCHLWDNVEKYYRAGQATDDNTEGYKYTLSICNTDCFSTATMVGRTRLSGTS